MSQESVAIPIPPELDTGLLKKFVGKVRNKVMSDADHENDDG